jgi:hypothetical protein
MIVPIDANIESCPLCGSAAVAKNNVDPSGNAPLAGIEFWCKCTNPTCAISPHATRTLDEAMAAWNRRVANEVQQ